MAIGGKRTVQLDPSCQLVFLIRAGKDAGSTLGSVAEDVQPMNAPSSQKPSIGRRIWTWITTGWVADVPEDIACCEFNCRKLQCQQGQWETCEYRIRYLALAKNHSAKGETDQDAE